MCDCVCVEPINRAPRWLNGAVRLFLWQAELAFSSWRDVFWYLADQLHSTPAARLNIMVLRERQDIRASAQRFRDALTQKSRFQKAPEQPLSSDMRRLTRTLKRSPNHRSRISGMSNIFASCLKMKSNQTARSETTTAFHCPRGINES